MIPFPEGLRPVEILSPAADAGGRTGDYISLKNVHRCWLVCHITQGNAATVALAPYQSTDVSDSLSDAKGLANAVPIWANEDLASSDALTAQTAAVNFTTSAAVKHKMVIFQIDPTQLDRANGFDCVTLTTGASNAANITQCIALCEMRYQQDDGPSLITD